MSWETEVLIEIPFHDADPMGIVWHGHYFKYFEIARTALLKTFSYDYPDMKDSGYAWPIIDCQCRYIKPVSYGMTIRVKVTLLEYANRLKLGYLITDAQTGRRLTKGTTIQVAVEMESNEMCLASPKVLLERLGVSHK